MPYMNSADHCCPHNLLSSGITGLISALGYCLSNSCPPRYARLVLFSAFTNPSPSEGSAWKTASGFTGHPRSFPGIPGMPWWQKLFLDGIFPGYSQVYAFDSCTWPWIPYSQEEAWMHPAFHSDRDSCCYILLCLVWKVVEAQNCFKKNSVLITVAFRNQS